MKLAHWIGIGLMVAMPSNVYAGSTTSDASGYGVDPSYKQCSPLLKNITPKSEAQRVFKNCMNMLQHKGVIDCGNGVTDSLNTACPSHRRHRPFFR